MSGISTHGTVAPGFEPVRDVFEQSFEKGELGAAVCAYVDGHKVVDLWGGWADADRTRQWQQDTIVTTYSATKGMTATCALRLVDRGLLDLDEPVATYWPEFAAAGKDKVTVRMLLSHQAGLMRPTVRIPPGKRWDWETFTTALARSTPAWEPGTRSEYHGGTFGYLVGEVVRRVDGRPLDLFFREEIGEPLGADFMIRFGPEHDPRCAEVIGDDEVVNTRRFRDAGDGASSGHGTAEGLARVYSALSRRGELDGVNVLRAETIEAAAQEQPHLDGTTGDFGLGYQLLWKIYPFGSVKPFGHTGMGGSIGLADPAMKVGFGYVMNKLGTGGAVGLLTATYQAVVATA